MACLGEHFGGHVFWAATEGIGQFAGANSLPAESKVCDFQIAILVDVHLEAHMVKPQPTPGVEELTDTELALSLLHELQRAVLCDGVVIILGAPIAKIEDVTSGVTRIKPDGLPLISVGVLLRVSYTQTFK